MSTNFIPFILMVYVSGGWDSTMVFDNKLNSSYANQEPDAAAATGAGNIAFIDHPDRPSVRTFFEVYGQNAAIVNGVYTGAMDRTIATRTQLGTVPPSSYRFTDWLSFYTYSTSPVMPLPHVVLNAPWLPGDYANIAVRLTSDTIKEYTAPTPAHESLGAQGEKALSAFRRNAYSNLLNGVNDRSLDGDKLKALFYSYSRHGNIYPELSKALNSAGDTSGDSEFIRNGKLAVELFAQGSSRSVTLQSGPTNEWDTTHNHYARQSVLYENLFAGLTSILDYANTRGVAGKMIVVVTSERGRAPRLNSEGGKDSWPYTSTLLWGVGIREGAVVGITDAVSRGVPLDPIFGRQLESGDPLEMGNIMSALYLKTNVPTRILLPDHKPLSPILRTD